MKNKYKKHFQYKNGNSDSINRNLLVKKHGKT